MLIARCITTSKACVQHHILDMEVYLNVAMTLLMCSQKSFITWFKFKYVAVIHSLSIIKCNFYSITEVSVSMNPSLGT